MGDTADISDVADWEWFTYFVGPARWRLKLEGDRQNAWIMPPDEVGDFYWSIADNTCGKELSYGWTETLDHAKKAVEYAIPLMKPRKRFSASCGKCGVDFAFISHEERLEWLGGHEFDHRDFVSFHRNFDA